MTLTERALRVAALGRIPSSDPHIIADMQDALDERLHVLKDLHAHCTAPDEQMRAAEFVIAKEAAAKP